jgi:multimeric flavodoxin WrbA
MMKNKRILIISGSPRKKGDGFSFLNSSIKRIDNNDIDFEFLFIKDYEIKPCAGCTTCFKKHESNCPQKDDISRITEKMRLSDGMIVISPIYGTGVVGQMKTFYDRIFFGMHRPFLYGKPVVNLATADVGSFDASFKFMELMTSSMGMFNKGAFGLMSIKYKNDETYKSKSDDTVDKLLKNLQDLVQKEDVLKPSFKELLKFNMWKMRNTFYKDMYAYDYEYWHEKGWMDSDYYYDVKIKPLEKLALGLMKKILPKALSRMTGIKS